MRMLKIGLAVAGGAVAMASTNPLHSPLTVGSVGAFLFVFGVIMVGLGWTE